MNSIYKVRYQPLKYVGHEVFIASYKQNDVLIEAKTIEEAREHFNEGNFGHIVSCRRLQEAS